MNGNLRKMLWAVAGTLLTAVVLAGGNDMMSHADEADCKQREAESQARDEKIKENIVKISENTAKATAAAERLEAVLAQIEKRLEGK